MTASAAPVAGLDDVVGHAETKARLWEALEQDRLPTGILLAGEDGRGKRTLAAAFARELLRRRADPGGADRAARRARDGSHSELIVLEPAPEERFLPVRRVRRLLERTSLSIAEGSLRVVLLLRLQKLNDESGNALLKFLEEPPPHVVVLATASDLGSVLETIRSRLRAHALGPLSDAEVARVVAGAGVPPAEAALAAPLAAGAPGAALRIVRGDLEGALLAPLRELLDPSSTAYAWAERRAKEAKEAGPDWAAADEAIGPPCATAALAELRAAKEEGVDGEKAGAGTLESARAWLRPLLGAAAFVAGDALRAARGVAPRAAELFARLGVAGAPCARDAAAAERARGAAATALENLDRNLSLPALLEAAARGFRPAP